MIKIMPSQVYMTQTQHIAFNILLNDFYKHTLYDNEKFNTFNQQLNKIVNNKEYVNNITNLIYSHLKSISNISDNNYIMFTSKILSNLICRETNMLEKLKIGGKNNFSYYVELSIIESTTKDSILRTIVKNEKLDTLKSVRQMQYFNETAIDQLLR